MRSQNDVGVSTEALRSYIGKNVEAFSEADVIRLGKVDNHGVARTSSR